MVSQVMAVIFLTVLFFNKDLFNLQPYFSSLNVFEGVGFFELHVNVCVIFTLQLYIFYGVIKFCCFM